MERLHWLKIIPFFVCAALVLACGRGPVLADDTRLRGGVDRHARAMWPEDEQSSEFEDDEEPSSSDEGADELADDKEQTSSDEESDDRSFEQETL